MIGGCFNTCLLSFLRDQEVEDEIQAQRREYAGEDAENDVTEAQYSGADLHPFAQSAKDTAHNGRPVRFTVMSIKFLHPVRSRTRTVLFPLLSDYVL